MPELEKDIERKVCKWAQDRGWLAYKFTSPGRRSVPDRIFARAGRIVFIEFKRPGGRLTDLQRREIHRLQRAGFTAVVAYSVEEAQCHLKQAET
jgi:hypothetical protein